MVDGHAVPSAGAISSFEVIIKHVEECLECLSKEPAGSSIPISDTVSILTGCLGSLRILSAELDGVYSFYGGMASLMQFLEEHLVALRTHVATFRTEQANSQSFLSLHRWNPFGHSSMTSEHKLQEIKENIRSIQLILPFVIEIVTKKTKASSLGRTQEMIAMVRQKHFFVPFWYKLRSKRLYQLHNILSLTYACLGDSHNYPFPFRHLKTFSTLVHCSLDSSTAQKKLQTFHERMDVSLLQRIWNLPQRMFVSTFFSLRLPSVHTSRVVLIPPPEEGPLQGMKIQAKLISSQALPFGGSIFPSLFSRKREQDTMPTMPIILHFHGGGFLSGSPSMHENYLREWAKLTGIPILSVDYRKAPEYKFPIALLECYHVYKWLLESQLGMKPSKIAVVGDSAGGNLAIGVIIKAIQDGIRLPDLLQLHYPSLDLLPTLYTSRFLFMNDIVVPCKALTVCGSAYIPQGANLRDPLLSPLYTPAPVLEKFPPVYFTSAEYDPLVDENVLFAARLQKHCKNPVSYKMYKSLPHGFLTFFRDIEAHAAVEEAAAEFKRLLL